MKLFENLNLNEFNEKDPYSIKERLGNSFSDELIIRKAKIHKIMGPKDDRLQVQPLPEFLKLEDEELDNLPIYPMFFEGSVITGEATDQGGNLSAEEMLRLKQTGGSWTYTKHEAEYVWCLCTKDFTVGYVLGKANQFGSGEKKKQYENSYSWSDVRSFLAQRRALPDEFDYKNVVVVNFFATDQGGMINCYNRKTGDWVLLNTTGSILTVQQKKIFMRVGSPPNPPSSGPVGFSMIEMTGDKILLKSPNIELDAVDLVLGKNSLVLGGMLTQGPVVGRNGVSVIPISTIHV